MDRLTLFGLLAVTAMHLLAAEGAQTARSDMGFENSRKSVRTSAAHMCSSTILSEKNAVAYQRNWICSAMPWGACIALIRRSPRGRGSPRAAKGGIWWLITNGL
jgi:hypothetical protein